MDEIWQKAVKKTVVKTSATVDEGRRVEGHKDRRTALYSRDQGIADLHLMSKQIAKVFQANKLLKSQKISTRL
jgi:hypothetical protein